MASSGGPPSDRDLALGGGPDEDIYQRLEITDRTYYSVNGRYPDTLCKQVIALQCLEKEGSSCPDHRTFARQDVQEFLNHEFGYSKGAWSILWNANVRWASDIVHEDGFRTIVGLKAIHVMVRPPEGYNQIGYGPARLYITPADVKNFLEAALAKNPSNPMGAVLGQATAIDAQQLKEATRVYAPVMELGPKIPLEWKVGLPSEAILKSQVQRWKSKACGGYKQYRKKKGTHSEQQGTYYNMAAGPSSVGASFPWPSQANQEGPDQNPYPQQSMTQAGKRRSWEMGGSQEIGPGSKRQSFGSFHSSTSQLGLASQSSGSSRDMSREGPAAEWDERAGSAMGHISTTMAGLAVTSAESSPAGIAPPTAGAPWGMPQGMPQDLSRTAFGQSGGGFEDQGRGGVEMVEEFGHWIERPMPGPSRMGFPPPMPPMVPAGQYRPPQRWQKEALPGQYPTQRHSGTGYSRHSGPSARIHDPDDPSGQTFPPRFPPEQRGSYGMDTHVPQPPRHMSGGSQQARDSPPRFRHMPITQSPELLDQAAGSAPPGSAFGPLHDLQPLPPAAMHGIDRAQFPTPTTLAPGSEDYPFSLAPGAQATPARVPFPPGPGFESGDPESGREDASESDGEDSVSEGQAPMEIPAFHQHQIPDDVELHAQGDREDLESGGEDAPGSYEEHSVSGREAAPQAPEIYPEDDSEDSESDGQDDQGSPSQYLGVPGGPRFYRSPSPNPPGQHTMWDPYVGRPGSEERGSDDPDSADEFKDRRTR